MQFPPSDDQNDRIRIERFWARELNYFKNLPLPSTNQVEDKPIFDLDDPRLQHYPPLLIHIFEKLFKIGNVEYKPKLDEKHSLKLIENINGLFQKDGNKTVRK